MVNAMPALTLPATITVNAASGGGAGGAGSSSTLDQISSSIGSGSMQAAAQQLLGGDGSAQNGGQLSAGGASVNIDGLQGLTGLTSSNMGAGLASSGLGLTSGGLRTFSLGSGSGNGAGISSSFSTSGSNGADSGSSSLDTENLSQGGIRAGIQQLSPNGQLVTNFVTRPQAQNDGFSFDNNGQRFVSFGGGRLEGFGGSSANTVPQGSWVVDVSSFGDTTSAPNTLPVNRSPEQSSPSFPQPLWSAHQQATVRSPINPNYFQDYVVPQRSASSVYYTVPETQSPNLSPRSLGYVARGGDGLQLQYARTGGGVYGGGPTTGQGYLAGGQLVPAQQQFQLAF